jgi:dGTPase
MTVMDDEVRTPSSLATKELRDLRDRRKLPSSQPAMPIPMRSAKRTKISRPSGRTAARKDRDRILYAEAFLRLVGVTQVVSPDLGGSLTHNRLTHSIKVGQVARSITEDLLRQSIRDDSLRARILSLGGLDADVAEAAALAHDIGHPPFGHIAEEILDASGRLGLLGSAGAVLIDGFEGNAQSFRIVTRLEGYGPEGAGLNLTAATRAAVVKYPWRRPYPGEEKKYQALGLQPLYQFMHKKFGFYYDDEQEFEDSREWLPDRLANADRKGQTLEASIMDIADDITYAIHDLQDFYQAGILDIQSVLADLNSANMDADASLANFAARLSSSYPSTFSEKRMVRAIKIADATLSFNVGQPYDPSTAAQLKGFVSGSIHEAVTAVRVHDEPAGDVRAYVRLKPDQWHLIQLYKHIVSHYIIERQDMGIAQHAQARLLLKLVGDVVEWITSDPDRLPRRLSVMMGNMRQGDGSAGHKEISDVARLRAVYDYICTLTDDGAVDLFRALRGFNIPSLLHQHTR